MRYTVTKQRIQVLGKLWMPICRAATELDLSAYDMENLGNPASRDDVKQWLLAHTGDFSSVTDFCADFHVGDQHIVHEWAREDSEWEFADCIHSSEDDDDA